MSNPAATENKESLRQAGRVQVGAATQLLVVDGDVWLEVVIIDVALADVSVADVSVAEVCVADVSVEEVSDADVWLADVSEAEVSDEEVSVADVWLADDVSVEEVSDAEVWLADVSEAEVSLADVCEADGVTSMQEVVGPEVLQAQNWFNRISTSALPQSERGTRPKAAETSAQTHNSISRAPTLQQCQRICAIE